MVKITDKTVNVSTGVLELKTKPVENTISPRQLGFDPPLEAGDINTIALRP